MTTWTTSYDSPIGVLQLAASEKGLSGLHFEDPRHPVDQSQWLKQRTPFAGAMKQLDQYFAGRLKQFDLQLDLIGTQFQKRVWLQLCAIPFGSTISYGELARRVGDSKAARAVGLANGRNPVAVIVPCHRVIGANGALTGFGGGLPRKRFLLDLEASEFALVGEAA